jgi:competence protein ComEC
MTRRSRSNLRRDSPLLPLLATALALGCGIPPLIGVWVLDAEVEIALFWVAAISALVAIGLTMIRHRWARISAALAIVFWGAGLAVQAGRWALPTDAQVQECASSEGRIAAGHPDGSRVDLLMPKDGGPVRMEGRVITIPQPAPMGSDWLGHELERDRATRFEIDEVLIGEGSGGGSPSIRGRVRISVSGDVPQLRIGDEVEVRGWLFPARGSRNPRPAPRPDDAWPSGGRSDSIVATVVAGPDAIRRTQPSGGEAFGWIADARATLRARVERVLERAAERPASGPPDPRPALAMTMLFGRGSHDDPETRDHFARSGLSHLVAISGFNFAVLALGAAILLRTFGGPWRATAVCTALLALAYLAVVDDEPSVARAGLVAVVAAGVESLGRRYRSMSLLGLAAVVLLIADPLAIGDPGFQLTFAAVLALRWAATPLARRWYGEDEEAPDSWPEAAVIATRSLIVSCLAVWLVVTPTSVVHFGQVSWLGLPLSIPAIPLGGLAIGNGLAVAAAAAIDERLAVPLAHSWMALTGALLWIAELPARCQVPDLDVGRVGWIWAAIVSVLALVWCRSVLWPIRRIAAVGLLLGWAPIAAAYAETPSDSPEWVMLDVGDGSCHVLRRGERAVIFDAGSLDLGSLGIRTAVPALRAAGVRRIEAVIVSHPNLDHFAAVPAILARFPTERLILNAAMLEAAIREPCSASGKLVEAARLLGVPVEQGAIGRTGQFLGAEWEWLHPDPDVRYAGENDGSQVISVRWLLPDGSFDLLLAGDIEAGGVQDLIRRTPTLVSDVIELPHHGSWRPAVAAWIERIRPAAVFQSTGPERWRRDRWEPVLAGAPRRVTCVDGAVRARVESRPGTGGPLGIRFDRWERSGWLPCGRIDLDRFRPESLAVSGEATSPVAGGSHPQSDRARPRSPRSRARGFRSGRESRSPSSRPRTIVAGLLAYRHEPRGRRTSNRQTGLPSSPLKRMSTCRAEVSIAPRRGRSPPSPVHPRDPACARRRTPVVRTKARFPSREVPEPAGSRDQPPARPRGGTHEGPRVGLESIAVRTLRISMMREAWG